jgi:uncharacterized lipoprotein YddW (UPF0748 family)
MRRMPVVAAAGLLLVSIAAADDDPAVRLAAPEYRCAWADTWHEGILSASQVTSLVHTLDDANYNVVIAEVRKCGDAYYDSAYEPRATNIADPPPFDPLADVLTKAHAARLEVHAWIVTYRIWNRSWPAPPPSHIWSQHPDWAMTNAAGSNLDGDYYNLDPAIPGVQDYVCSKVVADIVSKYDIDGFNFDYIRYPSGYTWGYNDITRQRFFDEYGFWPPTATADPNWETWAEYRRRQVTDLVRKCALEILWRNPRVKVTADTIGWSGANPNAAYTQTRQYKEVYQDSRRWMQDHLIDLNRLMNYKREYDAAQQADFREWSNWLSSMTASSGRHGIDGQAAYLNSIPDSIAQMAYARTAGCQGGATYSCAVTNKDGQPASDFWNAVRTQLYTEPAQVVDMPWKSAPVTAILFGQVTAPGEPADPIYQSWIYRATANLSGPATRSMSTDATGTYGFLDLPPGAYTVSVSKPGRPQSSRVVTVAAGDVVRQDFDLSDADRDSHAAMDDCDETNDLVWSPPSEASDLRWDSDKRTLTWQAPADPGGVSAPVYDTLRSTKTASFAGAVCIEAGGRDQRTRDADEPAPATGFYYLVRGDNPCPGEGSLGTRSDGTARSALPCF